MELALRFDATEADAKQAACFAERLNGWCREIGVPPPPLAASSVELRLELAADRLLDELSRLHAYCYALGVQLSFDCRGVHEGEEL